MSYVLRMSGEIHDWLSDLRRTDPAAATLTGQALAALMSEGASLGPPLVVPVSPAWSEDLLAELDSSYQHRLERLQVLRKRVAEAASLARDMRVQIDELESAQARLEDQHRRALEAGQSEEAGKAVRRRDAAEQDAAQAKNLLPWIKESERWLNTHLRRLQTRTDAFRARKELLKARYTAVRAELQVHDEMPDPGPADRDAATEAVTRLQDVSAEIERELGRQPLPEGLLELRPGAPGAPGTHSTPGASGEDEIRIIFAVEPPGTALVIAVLEGREAARDQYRDAVMLSADVLVEARAGQAPEASARGYDDIRAFAEEFFASQAAEIEAGAAALAANSRAHTLAEQRTRRGLTQTEVAQRMGISREQVAAIERADPGTTDVQTLAAYITALGGRLEITADFAGDRILLR